MMRSLWRWLTRRRYVVVIVRRAEPTAIDPRELL